MQLYFIAFACIVAVAVGDVLRGAGKDGPGKDGPGKDGPGKNGPGKNGPGGGGKKGKKCWKSLQKNNVWISTLGSGHVQMGYISGIQDNYPNPSSLSGAPNLTGPEMCTGLCDALGESYCAAAQYYQPTPKGATYNPTENWCNLLTPLEFQTAYASSPIGVTIAPVNPAFYGGWGFWRADC